MKARLASVVAALGLLFGMLLMGAGSAAATDGETSPTFDCANVIGVGQICDNIDDVVVTITHIGILSGDHLVNVENVLNNLAITGIDGDVTVIKGDVVNLYKNVFDIDILSGNVIVIGWPSCHC